MQNFGSAKLSYHKVSGKIVAALTGLVYSEEFVLVAHASSKHKLEGQPDNIEVWVAGRESTPVLAAAARLSIMEDDELIGGMPYKYTMPREQGYGMEMHLMLGISYNSADEAVKDLVKKEERLKVAPQVKQHNLRSLTPEFLLAAANEARDVFEMIDSGKPEPGAKFDGTAEETAELLEELVRVRAPHLATQLAWHCENDDERPQWQKRLEHNHTPDPNEYDEDEPVAHIVQAIDRIANIPATPVINNMLMVVTSALTRAIADAGAGKQDNLSLKLRSIQHHVEALLD